MKNLHYGWVIKLIFFTIILTGCAPQNAMGDSNDKDTPAAPALIIPSRTALSQTLLPTKTPAVISFWVDPEIDLSLISINSRLPGGIEADKSQAMFWLVNSKNEGDKAVLVNETYFVVSVSFISPLKTINFNELKEIWQRSEKDNIEVMIWAQPKDREVLSVIFSFEPGNQVLFSENEPERCREIKCLKISQFGEFDPQWRIIGIDDQNILLKKFDATKYPLMLRIWIIQNPKSQETVPLPSDISSNSNFNPEHLTSILMTGTTALVRNTAYQIEEHGLDFPIKNIKPLADSVDIVHVSNEVAFYSKCPSAVPVRKEMRFCSDPKYMDILNMLGTDVVELTGNHLLDWGPEAFLETLSIYKANNIQVYGGGETLELAMAPALVEDKGNRFAFLGCNIPGPENDWATNERPGSLHCDLDKIEKMIKDLRSQGINPIFTFQHTEYNTFRVTKQMQEDFWRMAKAGAVIVSGSQAHYPQGIDFVDTTFIHYGLGNFLFDQMYTYWGMATVDVHYFYENQYINTIQYPIINENYGQPRIMTDEEAQVLFDKIYKNSFYYKNENK